MAKKIIKLKAPGRVCLFGDHQDYLGLPIIACAIDRYVNLEARLSGGEVFNVDLPDIGIQRSLSIHPLKELEINKGDHLGYALSLLYKKGYRFAQGYDISIKGDLAINAGLSSSSALTVVWIQFLLSISKRSVRLDATKIAQLAYESEVTERGGAGGKMDQYTIALGKLIYLETDNNAAVRQLDANLPQMIIAESGIPKDTDGFLNSVKQNTFKAIRQASQIDKDFDLYKADLNSLASISTKINIELWPYLEAAVGNHQITKKALQELEEDILDIDKLGMLMNQHHTLLKDNLSVTVPLIDKMIDAANKAGAIGAKIVGSGRGGCIVALATSVNESSIIEALLKTGAKAAYAVNMAE